MSMTPHQLNTVTPYFTVADADALLVFLRDVFDGDVVKEDRNAEGRIGHARVRVGDSIIMLNEAGASYPANESQTHVYVDDVPATYAKALAFGATSLMEVNTRPHGDQMAGVRDPQGNTWWIASPG